MDNDRLPGANTSDPAAPFHVDLAGIDWSTQPPTHDPFTPGYPPATELPDGTIPGLGDTGNFVVGPSHPAAPETVERDGIARGQMHALQISSAGSTAYPTAVLREEESFNASVWIADTVPGDPSHLLVTTSRVGSWERKVLVYVPPVPEPPGGYPLLVVGDGEVAFGGGKLLPTVLDNLIADGRLPPIVAVLVGSGGQDAQGSQRGREYDTVSGTFAHWVDSEILPLVERTFDLRLTRDPGGRATVGGSSSGVAAFTMAWFRPDLFRRVLAYSPTFINQQWPHDPALPGGAWNYHSPWPGPAADALVVRGFDGTSAADGAPAVPLIQNSERKPIRVWFQVGDRDVFYPIPSMVDGMHDWVLASERFAEALAAKGYEYQFLFTRNGEHVDSDVVAQTLPAALEWLWHGYPEAPLTDAGARP